MAVAVVGVEVAAVDAADIVVGAAAVVFVNTVVDIAFADEAVAPVAPVAAAAHIK